MQTRNASLLGIGLACAVSSALAQGTFQNLGFEQANLPSVPPGQYGGNVSALDAIPGWTAFIGTNQVTQLLHNNLTLGYASIDMIGPYWTPGYIIEGQYGAVLQPGADPFGSGYTSASISQVGQVPANARSIQLKAASSPFSVSIGGQDLFLTTLDTGSNYILYGADISSFAGQSASLTITALAGPNRFDYFDSIVFSTEAVPEPGVFALAAVGASLIGWRALGRRR